MSAIESVLLRRLQKVYVDQPPAAASPGREGVRPLEGELLERGHALSPELHAALGALAPTDLAEERLRLLALVDGLMGSDRVHRPLFRRFPFSIPRDTERWYVDRVFALLLQAPAQPCVLCGETGTVHPVAPCAHLVCRACWDGADYTGCPVCHRRVDPADPFLRPDDRATRKARAKDKAGDRAGNTSGDRAGNTAGGGLPAGPLRLLRLGTDLPADCARVVSSLLARQTPLSPEDRDDLALLLHRAPAALDWLPTEIPVRETKALVLGTLLAGWRTQDAARPLLASRLTTATDVLRLLAVVSGGDAGLLPLPRFTGIGRPLRRELLGVLDALPAQHLVEDLLRHPTAWKRAAEVLHPFERYARHPRAALAFAVLRDTKVTPATPFGAALVDAATAHPDAVRLHGDRIRPATWAGRLEQALSERRLGEACALAGQRPGELVRRLDHLLRLHGADPLVPELEKALARGLPAVGAGPLLSALGALRVRGEDRTGSRRVFFPRGRVASALSVAEERPPLPAPLVASVVALLEGEVLRRFADTDGEPYDLAVLERGLAELTVPFAERTAAKALVAVGRGSTQALPEGEVLRLFLHWTEPAGTRTDLDLSVAFFDGDWNFTGLCDYTELTHGPDGAAAVHSGDLTSAPAPDGATEYVDLDLAALARHGDAFAVPLVFSYNNVPFDELPDAFAGFIALPADGPRDSSYDPRTVRQRFDLAGDSRVCMPMVVDLGARRALWADVHLPPAAGFQSVRSHGSRLGAVASDLWAHFGSGTRATLWDLTVWRAAARSREVTVLRRTTEPGMFDELWLHRRRPDEDVAAFAARIGALADPEERWAHRDADAAVAEAAAGKRVFLALVHPGVAPRAASGTAYRLFPGTAELPGSIDLVSAGELVAELGGEDNGATAVGPGPYPL
ncbi:MXAN_6230/SCO0854 family RING domain-containing protein [Streptomyces sp. NPDC048603]|uniref:MXAN_6230/SCO0854 family RING domain-containing protein n=1 Tax=Streptomyces sp. NPDC048603 TaxID=3365577 RepID=UPI00371CC8B2